MTKGGATRDFAVTFADENGVVRTEKVVAFAADQAAAALRWARPGCAVLSCSEAGGGRAVP